MKFLMIFLFSSPSFAISSNFSVGVCLTSKSFLESWEVPDYILKITEVGKLNYKVKKLKCDKNLTLKFNENTGVTEETVEITTVMSDSMISFVETKKYLKQTNCPDLLK